jgi:hypothetical protein
MPVAIPGLIALRRHLFGRQEDFGIANTAARAYPFSGVPDVNLNWTDVEGDFGSVDPIAPPYRGAADLTANLTDNAVAYDDLPLMLASILGDDVEPTGGGAAKTWTFQPASLTQDDIDVFSYEFGDDVEEDWFHLFDGLTESITFTFPRGLGPVTASMNWRFGSARYAGASEAALQPDFSIPTAGLTVDSAAIPVYLGDAKLYINDSAGTLGNTQISDALYGGTLTISRELDQKRFVNGTGFDLSGYSSGKRNIEFQMDFAKTGDIVGSGSESDAWFSATAVDRFVRLAFTSTSIITGVTPYSWEIDMPLRYYTRADDAEGGNSVVSLTGHQFYQSATLGYAFKSVVVNKLALTGFETAAS